MGTPEYSKEFKAIIAIILKDEGGYVNDKDDAGGETRYGISKNANPDVDIANLTIEKAIDIYYARYYIPNQLERIISVRVRWKVMEICVNASPERGIKILQDAVGAKSDGMIGPDTLRKVNKMDEDIVMFNLIRGQVQHYARCVARDPARNSKFIVGWINRAFDTGEELYSVT